MEQTLHQQRVQPTSMPHPSTLAEVESRTVPMPDVRWERTKKFLKNPLVLVGVTWVVMALLLAREIFTR